MSTLQSELQALRRSVWQLRLALADAIAPRLRVATRIEVLDLACWGGSSRGRSVTLLIDGELLTLGLGDAVDLPAVRLVD